LYEIIVIDDSSTDETFKIAKRLADVALVKKREGQTKGLLVGMKLAKYPVVVTIDSDLENDPRYIPSLIEEISRFDVVVASRSIIPRLSEKIASKTLGKLFGVTDSFSNYRAYNKDVVPLFTLKGGETFGAEFLAISKKHNFKIGAIMYEAPPRRKNPRIGGTINANIRIIWASIKTLVLYLF
jgi:dolichol-phosphate mannosyltransferase